MPENESLIQDPRSVTRWQPVRRKLDAGVPPAELFPAIEDTFHRWLNKAWKQWKARGVDAADLIAVALSGPAQRSQTFDQLAFDSNAKLLCQVADALVVRTKEGLIGEFLDAIWEHARSILQLDRRDDMPNCELSDKVQGMLDRMRRLLIRNPSRVPPRTRRGPLDSSGKVDLSDDLL